MAFDPKKWTIKTQEAFSAAIDDAKARSNPELTPDHVLSAMMRQDGTIVPAVLAKLGQAPLQVRKRTTSHRYKVDSWRPRAVASPARRSVWRPSST